jgi:hypothetical protein
VRFVQLEVAFYANFKWQSKMGSLIFISFGHLYWLVRAEKIITYHCWGQAGILENCPPNPHRVPGRFLKAHKP